LLIVGEELAVNVFKYAYDATGSFALTIDVDPDARKVSMEFRDSGREYNPLDKPDPDTGASISERQIGGLGIMFSKRLSDEQCYVRESGENVFTVVKSY